MQFVDRGGAGDLASAVLSGLATDENRARRPGRARRSRALPASPGRAVRVISRACRRGPGRSRRPAAVLVTPLVEARLDMQALPQALSRRRVRTSSPSVAAQRVEAIERHRPAAARRYDDIVGHRRAGVESSAARTAVLGLRSATVLKGAFDGAGRKGCSAPLRRHGLLGRELRSSGASSRRSSALVAVSRCATPRRWFRRSRRPSRAYVARPADREISTSRHSAGRPSR